MKEPRFPLFCDIRASRTIQAPSGEREAISRIARKFWESRGFRNFREEDGFLTAQRGSWLGNFTSFDMGDLRATLNLCLDDSGSVLCEMRISGLGQVITLYNRAYWAMELAQFESSLRGRKVDSLLWSEFETCWRRGAVHWAASMGTLGHGMSPEARDVLERAGARLDEVQPYRILRTR